MKYIQSLYCATLCVCKPFVCNWVTFQFLKFTAIFLWKCCDLAVERHSRCFLMMSWRRWWCSCVFVMTVGVSKVELQKPWRNQRIPSLYLQHTHRLELNDTLKPQIVVFFLWNEPDHEPMIGTLMFIRMSSPSESNGFPLHWFYYFFNESMWSQNNFTDIIYTVFGD